VSDEAELGLELLLLMFVAGWFAGYGWALYRAVGWVDRMRAWAGRVVELQAEETSEGVK
jgi:hypothetical protein